MSWNDTLYNALRIHDKAVYDWLGGIHVDYGNISGTPFPSTSILRIYATPDNAFARMADVLIRKGWIVRPTEQQQLIDAEAYKIVPLPMASIYRQNPENDPQRAGVPLDWRRFTYNPQTGKYDNHPYPGTYSIGYQIDFWCLKKYTEAHIYEWLMGQIGHVGAAPNEIMLPVDHGPPWGLKIQGFKLESFVDNTEIEAIEAERRYIRYTATFILNGLVFRPPVEGAKPILKISLSSHDLRTVNPKKSPDGQLLETIPIDYALFRDDGQVPDSILPNFFDITGTGTTVKRSNISSDGRVDPFTKRSSTNEYGSFQFIYPSAGGTLTNQGLKLPAGRIQLGFRFAYYSPDADCWFALTDGSGVHLQRWALPKNRVWTQFECFITHEGNIGARWGCDAAANFFIDRIQIPLVPVSATAIAPTSDSVIMGSRVVRFENLNKRRPYFFSCDLLNYPTDYSILVGDAGGDPLLTTQMLAVSGQWLNASSVIQPSDTGAAEIVLVNNPSAVSLPEAREYFGYLRGNYAPLE